jgi:hypothetical protein
MSLLDGLPKDEEKKPVDETYEMRGVIETMEGGGGAERERKGTLKIDKHQAKNMIRCLSMFLLSAAYSSWPVSVCSKCEKMFEAREWTGREYKTNLSKWRSALL